jgi:hypothetical protein
LTLTWTGFKKTATAQVIKPSYIVLVALPIILELIDKLHFSYKLPYGITVLFFGSLSILISAILFNPFCPSILKDYKDIHDYINKRAPELQKTDPKQWINIIYTQLDETQSDRAEEIKSLHVEIESQSDPALKSKATNQLDQLATTLFPNAVQTYLQTQWNDADTVANRATLKLTYGTWLAGMLALGFVCIERVITIIKHLSV